MVPNTLDVLRVPAGFTTGSACLSCTATEACTHPGQCSLVSDLISCARIDHTTHPPMMDSLGLSCYSGKSVPWIMLANHFRTRLNQKWQCHVHACISPARHQTMVQSQEQLVETGHHALQMGSKQGCGAYSDAVDLFNAVVGGAGLCCGLELGGRQRQRSVVEARRVDGPRTRLLPKAHVNLTQLLVQPLQLRLALPRRYPCQCHTIS